MVIETRARLITHYIKVTLHSTSVEYILILCSSLALLHLSCSYTAVEMSMKNHVITTNIYVLFPCGYVILT